MKRKKNLFVLTVLAIAFIFPALAFADMYYEQTTYEEFLAGVGRQTLSKETHQKIQVKGLSMRIDEVESNTTLLVRLDKRVTYELNNRKKTYKEMPFHEMEMEKGVDDIRGQQLAPQMEAGMKSAQRGMLEATSSMPGDRKDFMRKMMLQQMRKMGTLQKTGATGGKITAKKLKKEKVVNGYKCKRYKILEDATPVVDMWVTEQITPPLNYADFFESINVYKSEVAAEIKKIKGMPIKVRYVENFDLLRKVQYIKEVTKVQVKAITDSTFAIPKGFKKVSATESDNF